MKKIILIRHGKTIGNTEARYIGTTDQPLCDEGIAALREMKYPQPDIIFCSPMKRCLQTASLIYPDLAPSIVRDLRECEFGYFEGKNHAELDGNEYYQRWIDSGGSLPFPNGESPNGFRQRVANAFVACVNSAAFGSAAFVVHGGTIMAVMEAFAIPQKSYFDYMVKNGHGFIGNYDGARITDAVEL